MAIVVGVKEGGITGVLSNNELKQYIFKRSGERAELKNCGNCANDIESFNSTSDQGGTSLKCDGKTVFHFSHGKKGGKTGCTVFFTVSEHKEISHKGTDKQKDTKFLLAKIVGVGWHAKGTDDHTYDIDWGKAHPFSKKATVDTAKTNVKPG